jgi:hypothetical protein
MHVVTLETRTKEVVKYIKLHLETYHASRQASPVQRAIAAIPQLSLMTTIVPDQQSLKDEIADLERRLKDAKARLNSNSHVDAPSTPASDTGVQQPSDRRVHGI